MYRIYVVGKLGEEIEHFEKIEKNSFENICCCAENLIY